ncbi:MAG: hypothetical protein HY841_03960 [Bacteroidetes bacterium]|nr:hypothetical protein [Bacteroidota bacterium]
MEKPYEKIEKYDPIKLEKIKQFLEGKAIKGSPRYYEIHVDNLKVVEKTNSLDDFDTYEEYLYDDVKEVVVQIYTTSAKSPRPLSRHVFLLEEEKKEEPKKAELLSGTEDIKTQITEQVTVAKERWDAELVKKELETANQKLQQAENYIEILTRQLEEKGKGDDMKDLGNTLIKEVLPHFLGNKSSDGKTLSGSEEKKGETTFQKKTAETNNTLSEEDKRHLEFIRALEDQFDEEQMAAVLDIVNALGENTENIKTVASMLNLKQESQQQK